MDENNIEERIKTIETELAELKNIIGQTLMEIKNPLEYAKLQTETKNPINLETIKKWIK